MFASMKAVRRACRSRTFGEYSKSIAVSLFSGEQLLDLFPSELGGGPRAPARLHRLRARRVARDRSRHHALEDGGGAEHVVRHAEAEIPRGRRMLCPRALQVLVDVFAFARNAQRREIDAAQSA